MSPVLCCRTCGGGVMKCMPSCRCTPWFARHTRSCNLSAACNKSRWPSAARGRYTCSTCPALRNSLASPARFDAEQVPDEEVGPPAAAVGRRTSPLDEGNLNRLFPGDPMGSPTAQIAHFVDTVLLPMTQVSLDLHSGGSSLEYLPCVYATASPDTARQARLQAAVTAFGAPLVLMAQQEISSRSLMACARAHGHLHFATELGGAGTTTPATQAIADRGVLRLLAHLGVIDPVAPPPDATRMMRISGSSQYVYAPVRGLFEPAFALGDTVQVGQPAGCIHFPEEPERAPCELVFADSGMVVCRRVPSLVAPGDCVAHLAADF